MLLTGTLGVLTQAADTPLFRVPGTPEPPVPASPSVLVCPGCVRVSWLLPRGPPHPHVGAYTR